MKKILVTMIALLMCNVMSWAVSISAADVDFGTVSIQGKESTGVDGSTTLPVSWSNLPLYSQVNIAAINPSSDKCIFAVDGLDTTFVWTGSGYSSDPFVYSYDCEVSYLAEAAGTYSCQIHIFVYDPDITTDYIIIAEKTINVSLTVTEQATGIDEAKAKVESRKELRDGRLVIMRNGEEYSASGAKIK